MPQQLWLRPQQKQANLTQNPPDRAMPTVSTMGFNKWAIPKD